jgi:hypothetical protein
MNDVQLIHAERHPRWSLPDVCSILWQPPDGIDFSTYAPFRDVFDLSDSALPVPSSHEQMAVLARTTLTRRVEKACHQNNTDPMSIKTQMENAIGVRLLGLEHATQLRSKNKITVTQYTQTILQEIHRWCVVPVNDDHRIRLQLLRAVYNCNEDDLSTKKDMMRLYNSVLAPHSAPPVLLTWPAGLQAVKNRWNRRRDLWISLLAWYPPTDSEIEQCVKFAPSLAWDSWASVQLFVPLAIPREVARAASTSSDRQAAVTAMLTSPPPVRNVVKAILAATPAFLYNGYTFWCAPFTVKAADDCAKPQHFCLELLVRDTTRRAISMKPADWSNCVTVSRTLGMTIEDLNSIKTLPMADKTAWVGAQIRTIAAEFTAQTDTPDVQIPENLHGVVNDFVRKRFWRDTDAKGVANRLHKRFPYLSKDRWGEWVEASNWREWKPKQWRQELLNLLESQQEKSTIHDVVNDLVRKRFWRNVQPKTMATSLHQAFPHVSKDRWGEWLESSNWQNWKTKHWREELLNFLDSLQTATLHIVFGEALKNLPLADLRLQLLARGGTVKRDWDVKHKSEPEVRDIYISEIDTLDEPWTTESVFARGHHCRILYAKKSGKSALLNLAHNWKVLTVGELTSSKDIAAELHKHCTNRMQTEKIHHQWVSDIQQQLDEWQTVRTQMSDAQLKLALAVDYEIVSDLDEDCGSPITHKPIRQFKKLPEKMALYPCPGCSSEFHTQAALRAHIIRMHKSVRHLSSRLAWEASQSHPVTKGQQGRLTLHRCFETLKKYKLTSCMFCAQNLDRCIGPKRWTDIANPEAVVDLLDPTEYAKYYNQEQLLSEIKRSCVPVVIKGAVRLFMGHRKVMPCKWYTNADGQGLPVLDQDATFQVCDDCWNDLGTKKIPVLPRICLANGFWCGKWLFGEPTVGELLICRRVFANIQRVILTKQGVIPDGVTPPELHRPKTAMPAYKAQAIAYPQANLKIATTSHISTSHITSHISTNVLPPAELVDHVSVQFVGPEPVAEDECTKVKILQINTRKYKWMMQDVICRTNRSYKDVVIDDTRLNQYTTASTPLAECVLTCDAPAESIRQEGPADARPSVGSDRTHDDTESNELIEGAVITDVSASVPYLAKLELAQDKLNKLIQEELPTRRMATSDEEHAANLRAHSLKQAAAASEAAKEIGHLASNHRERGRVVQYFQTQHKASTKGTSVYRVSADGDPISMMFTPGCYLECFPLLFWSMTKNF